MKVLLITNNSEDYLQDSIIHGFKELLGNCAYDYPVKEILYDDFKQLSTIRGNGFTLYGLVNHDLKSKEMPNIRDDIKHGSFDLIVFTSIFRQYKLFFELYPLLKRQRVWVMDGEDTDILFPYLGQFFKKSFFWMNVKPHKHFSYFKRELTSNTIRSYYYRLISNPIAQKLKLHRNIKPIAFAIPKEKIVEVIPQKTKLFTEHIVDSEVGQKLIRKSTNYSFTTEADYYADIQNSKFGVTTKRAGWDCLRHYEIAANGAVICFKDLDKKPELCAPHGLVGGYNCISYNNYEDLMNKINALSDDEYFKMLHHSLDWIRQNSTLERVRKLLKDEIQER